MLIYNKLIEKLENNKSKKPLKIALIDPDKKNDKSLPKQLEYINNNNFIAAFCGGSIIMDSKYSTRVEYIKNNISIPLIGFPSSAYQIDSNFDAILFMSLISGRNPQYLIGEQVLSAPIIKDLSLEVISIGYILLSNGKKTTVELISGTDGLPVDNHNVVISHALAAQYLGHKMIYLECGSNADAIIDLKLLSKINNLIDIPIIVGGGVKNDKDIDLLTNNGASFVVTSSMIESISK